MRYQVLRFHRHSAKAHGGNFGVYDTARSDDPWSANSLLSVHFTLDDANQAAQRLEAINDIDELEACRGLYQV